MVCYKWSSNQSGVLGRNNPACFRVCSSQSWQSWEPCPLPTLRVLFRCILLDVSSVFWLFFQSNLILINHPHRLSLAKSEWWVCRKVVVNIQQIKSNAEGPSPLRIPACSIIIMESTLSKDAKPFSSFPHNKFLFCSHNIGYTDVGELMGGKLRKSVLHVMWCTQLISSSCFRQVLWYSAGVSLPIPHEGTDSGDQGCGLV